MREFDLIRLIGKLGFYYQRAYVFRKDIDYYNYYNIRLIKGRVKFYKITLNKGKDLRQYGGTSISFDEVFESLTPEQKDIAIFNLDILR
jgi:hypothetical protein